MYFRLIIFIIFSTSLFADSISDDEGSISGQIRAMYLLHDRTNTFTPRNGSAYLLKLKYDTPRFADDFTFTTAVYINGDTGLTDFEDTNKKKALGMFLREKGKSDYVLGEAYLEYKKNNVAMQIGRQRLHTPLTKIAWSFVPNFYESAFLTLKTSKKISLSLGHISAMSHGTRAAADFGLIGEKTGTAGTVRPMATQSGNGIHRGDFLNIGEAAGVSNTKGISIASVTYKFNDNLKASTWDFYAHDIANTFYFDMKYTVPTSLAKVVVDTQYLKQSDIGKSLAGAIDFTMYGAKVKVSLPKYSVFAAINKSGDGGKYFNAWGSDPAYTSSIFSRNEYRNDVAAYKVGAEYKILSNLKFVVSYANYGKSKTLGWSNESATDDATAINSIILYRPVKHWLIKFFNVRRVSEYNTATTQRKMNQFRFITNYEF